jgi:hypothetical protein
MQPSPIAHNVFFPVRQPGLVFHIIAILTFALVSAISLWQAAHAHISPLFLLYLLPALAAIGIVIWLSYRVYALQNSSYTIGRDGIHLHWGLRLEDIPIDEVMWVHLASDLSAPLPLPGLRWPGALLGQRCLPDGDQVEFLASTPRGLIVIATPGRDFAISPEDPNAFLLTFQRCTEMGSLTPLEAHSIYPTFLLGQVWADLPARFLLIAGSTFSLILLVWVSLVIPSRSQIHLGFFPDGSPGYVVPAVRLMLLPVLNTFFCLVSILLGLFFFRREESQPLSYLLWGSGILTPILFMIAVSFTLRAG